MTLYVCEATVDRQINSNIYSNITMTHHSARRRRRRVSSIWVLLLLLEKSVIRRSPKAFGADSLKSVLVLRSSFMKPSTDQSETDDPTTTIAVESLIEVRTVCSPPGARRRGQSPAAPSARYSPSPRVVAVQAPDVGAHLVHAPHTRGDHLPPPRLLHPVPQKYGAQVVLHVHAELQERASVHLVSVRQLQQSKGLHQPPVRFAADSSH